MINPVITYKELCIIENIRSVQKGMNFRLNSRYSVILMSQRTNAPYNDNVKEGETVIYEGHNIPAQTKGIQPETIDQPYYTKKGKLTENGKFALAVHLYKNGKRDKEHVKIYEKLYSGLWAYRGLYLLDDYEYWYNGKRNIFRFTLVPYTGKKVIEAGNANTRYIPSPVKKAVWQRDKGKCVICGSGENLQFDHDLPYSRGGSSISADNIRILCAECNLKKSDKIE